MAQYPLQYGPMSSVFQSELNPGEQLLWSDQPQPRPLFDRSLLSENWSVWVPLGGIVGFMLLAGAGNPPFMLIIGGLLVVLVLLSIGSHFWENTQHRAHTHYALTNERILILFNTVQQKHIRSLSLKTLADLQLSLNPNGSGSIFFNPISPAAKWSTPQPAPTAAFEHIAHARQVYDLVQQALRAAQGGQMLAA